ncbi:hypothetical protein FHG66_19120 [Rubellimicrobium rubrum]|uniref:Uncharacterized protein n=1 Tax=Rubellimicrobium rubrum TaxID=2585369 RepID=A0A5C4MPB2_9RHOB|nr:hypothetical protein [Rubellimicrobium rubrum]TNC46255.1 hypothetical protein FHG66_19120 [Rubellimicrobium rubrum]
MRSAIYYPRTQVHSRPLMQSSLLLWDQLHTIVPDERYSPDYHGRRDMAEAWELIGKPLVPSAAQKSRAHTAIETTLQAGLPPDLYFVGRVDQPEDPYEVWPQKFSTETWDLMLRHKMTGGRLPNGDYPFTQEGGLLVMAKLADACAGSQFARVTDRLMAYGLIGSGSQRPGTEADVVPITLNLIDASSIPIENLIALRRREQRERRGSDYTKMRHNYADMVQAQITMLGQAADQFERDELNRQFRARMAADLKDLRRELGSGRTDLVLKPVIVTTIVAGASVLAGTLDVPTAIAAGVAAAVGSEMREVAKTIGDFLGDGLKFDRSQRETMAKHPMAYMYALSTVR